MVSSIHPLIATALTSWNPHRGSYPFSVLVSAIRKRKSTRLLANRLRARGTDERDTAVVGVDGRVAAGESDAGAGLLSRRQRHGGGEEEGKREETHSGC